MNELTETPNLDQADSLPEAASSFEDGVSGGVSEAASSDSVSRVEDGEENDGREWYIIQCFSTHEYRVRDRILEMVDREGWSDIVFRVLVPEEETVEVKNNKRVERVVRIYPGYVFIQMILDDQVCFQIRQIHGVSQFIGMKNQPTPVQDDEMLKVLRKVGDKTRRIEVDFEVGEEIKAISGPFRGYTGPISEIFPERGKLKALISIFGRETPVELEFDHVESAANAQK